MAMAFKVTEAGMAGVVGAVLNPLAAWFLFTHLTNSTLVTLMAAGIGAALVIGMIEGLVIRPSCLSAVVVGTLVGGLLMWSPVIVATHGFALMALPALAALTVFVWFGTCVGSFLRSRARPSSQ